MFHILLPLRKHGLHISQRAITKERLKHVSITLKKFNKYILLKMSKPVHTGCWLGFNHDMYFLKDYTLQG